MHIYSQHVRHNHMYVPVFHNEAGVEKESETPSAHSAEVVGVKVRWSADGHKHTWGF